MPADGAVEAVGLLSRDQNHKLQSVGEREPAHLTRGDVRVPKLSLLDRPYEPSRRAAGGVSLVRESGTNAGSLQSLRTSCIAFATASSEL